MKKTLVFTFVQPLAFFLLVGLTHAHGVIGKRFFPSTIVLEDPFISDEMDLLKFERGSISKEGRETSLGFEFAKRLTRDLTLGVEWEYLFADQNGDEESQTSGAGNPEFSLKYALFRSITHEFILSSGFAVEPGGVGPIRVAERVTTLTPSLFFGKGLGDLPESVKYLKPIAITGSLGINVPANGKTVTTSMVNGELEREVERHVTTISYGLAMMYSIPYLQSFIRDVGLNAPFNRLFPLVEFNFETNADRSNQGHTNAFLNPGLLWAGKYVELELEAQVPLNGNSGKNVGVLALIHLFLDNLAPDIFTWTPWGTLGGSRR
ncbi:MAG: hypothetical protein ACE5HC_08785 [Candidatus Binatia bacterium]